MKPFMRRILRDCVLVLSPCLCFLFLAHLSLGLSLLRLPFLLLPAHVSCGSSAMASWRASSLTSLPSILTHKTPASQMGLRQSPSESYRFGVREKCPHLKPSARLTQKTLLFGGRLANNKPPRQIFNRRLVVTGSGMSTHIHSSSCESCDLSSARASVVILSSHHHIDCSEWAESEATVACPDASRVPFGAFAFQVYGGIPPPFHPAPCPISLSLYISLVINWKSCLI